MSSRLHYSVAQLAAFAVASQRGSGEYREVLEHLRRGCVPCSATVRRYEIGRSPFAAQRRRSTPKFWLIPETRSAVAGMRAGVHEDVSITCEVGGFGLDLLIRELPDRPTLEFDGQITRAGSGHEPVPELTLAVLDANFHAPVASTVTDEFGEFALTPPRAGPYGLRIGSGDGAPCVLVWEDRPSAAGGRVAHGA